MLQTKTSTRVNELQFDAIDSSTTEDVIWPNDVRQKWGPVQIALFRFIFAYFVLDIFPFPLNPIPRAEIVSTTTRLGNTVVPWVGNHLFHVAITVLPNGGGDTTFNYVQVYCYLTITAAIAVVWTMLDWKRARYSKLCNALRVYVRYSLATTMINYGAVKARIGHR